MSGFEGLLTGRTLVKRYRIEQVIGRGGFAAVYRADDERLGRPVAVKVITIPAPDDATRQNLHQRFQREARSVASLPQHPNVVTVHDFGTDPELGLDFLVMEFLHGEDLASHLSRNGRPPLALGLRILRDAAEGLAVGHRAGLIHRDVKPGNIFLAEAHGEEPFRVCVLDFGIARATTDDQDLTRLTQGGTPLSPAYASPEQMRGERDLAAASDVFSMGVVAYQLLTGDKPLAPDRTPSDPSAWVPARSIREINPEVPEAVEAVVSRAMAFAPQDRFADAGAMAAALDDAMEGAAPAAERTVIAPAAAALPDDRTLLQPEPQPAAAPPVDRRAPPPPRRRSAAVTWAVVMLVLAGVAAAGVWALGGDGEGDVDPVVEPGVVAGEVDPSQPVLQPGEDGGAEGTVVEPVPATGTVQAGESLPATSPRTGSAAPASGGIAPAQPQPQGQPQGQARAPTAGAPAAAAPQPAQPTATPAPAARPTPAPANPPAPDTARPRPDSASPPPLLGVPVQRRQQQPAPADTSGG